MRDKQIDILRFLGLSLLILGHVHPPQWLFQFRNFNAVLLVIASGMALAKHNIDVSFKAYVWKRFKRLALPAWLFLTVYFLSIWITGISFEQLTLGKVIKSFLFLREIGYVWIIRVFILIAIATPPILAINRKIKSNSSYILFLIFSFLLYEIVFSLTVDFTIIEFWKISSLLVYYIIAYSIIFALGVRIKKLNSFEVLFVFAFSLIVFIGLYYTYSISEGHSVSTQVYKFPPSAYYLSYGTFSSILIIVITKNAHKYLEKISTINKIVIFIAQNSFLVYLWHIPFLKISFVLSSYGYLAEYFFVYTLAAIAAYFQVKIVQIIILPSIQNEIYKKNIKIILCG